MHPLPCYSAGSSTKDKTVIILLALLQLISTLKGSMGTGTNFTWFPMISYVSAGFLETYPYLLLQWGTASMHTFQISQGSSKNLRIFRNLLSFRWFFCCCSCWGFLSYSTEIFKSSNLLGRMMAQMYSYIQHNCLGLVSVKELGKNVRSILSPHQSVEW